MHWGKILEVGTSDQVYNHPIHPYTKSLLSSIPSPDPISERERTPIVYDPTAELDGQERENAGNYSRTFCFLNRKQRQKFTRKTLLYK